MTDAEWAVIRPLLPVPAWMNGRGGQPEAYCHRQMIDAIRYLVDNGIKWRAMPDDFPAWDRVYAFFRRWRDHRLVGEFHDRLRVRVRQNEGRDAEPSAAIVDSQSVKAAACVPAASRGFDAGKNINGRKRHVIVDCLGLLLMVLVTPADVTDRQAVCGMLPHLLARHRRIRLLWADGCPRTSSYAEGSTGSRAEAGRHWGQGHESVIPVEGVVGWRTFPRVRLARRL